MKYMIQFLPPVAGVLFIAFTACRIAAAGVSRKNTWLFPAGLSLAFFVFSLSAVVVEGPIAFWAEHTRNLWGNQIWFDLLLAVAIAWYFVVPKARAVGMSLAPWLALVVGTGSIGVLAMVARLLFLEAQDVDG